MMDRLSVLEAVTAVIGTITTTFSTIEFPTIPITALSIKIIAMYQFNMATHHYLCMKHIPTIITPCVSPHQVPLHT